MQTWDLLKGSPVFEGVAGWSPAPTVRLLDAELGRLLVVYKATSNLLTVLGSQPVAGRGFTAQEDEEPSESVLLSHQLWRDVFSSDPNIIGRRLSVALARAGDFVSNYEIVGVLPIGFALGGVEPDLVQPEGTSAGTHRMHSTPVFRIIARLAPQSTLELADSFADGVLRSSEASEPTEARVVALSEDERRRAVQPAWLLVTGAALMSLVSCANVGGLLLADARRRRSEMALRAMLGGRTWHFVRQLALEYALVTSAAVVVGLILAYWLVGLVAAFAPPGLAGVEYAGIDLRIAVFAVLMASCTVLAAGIVPAVSMVRIRAAVVMAAGYSRLSPSVGHGFLVAAQTSLTVALAASATVLAERLFESAAARLGFNSQRLVMVSATSAGTQGSAGLIRTADAANAGAQDDGAVVLHLVPSQVRTRRLLESLAAFPHVVSVAASTVGPFATAPGFVRIQSDGLSIDTEYPAQVYGVTDAYFETMQIPLIAGRSFDSNTFETQEVVVSREFARRYLGSAPVGSRFYEVVGPKGQGARFPFRVVGVVGDVKQRAPMDEDAPVYYQRFGGDLGNLQHFVLRTSKDVPVLTADLKRRLAELEPGLLVTRVADVDQLVTQSMAEERFRAVMSATFAGAAMILATFGLYGLTVRRMAERRQELGIRIALGASAMAVRILVIRNVLRTVGAGLAGGIVLGLLATAALNASFGGAGVPSPQALVLLTLFLGGVVIATMLAAVRGITCTEATSSLMTNIE